jgi:hypothetical protein
MPKSSREGESQLLSMREVRFIQKDGQSVEGEAVRRRFFEAAIAAKVHPDRVCRIWNNAMFGDPHARRLVEKQCGIEIVAADAGFGFLE